MISAPSPNGTGHAGPRRMPEGTGGHDTFGASAAPRRRAIALLLLSLFLPGLAQIIAGNRAIGRVVLRTWLAMIGLVILIGITLAVSLSAGVTLMSTPWVLSVAQWLLYAWALVWAAVVIDAWRLGRPTAQPAQTRRWLALATAALMLAPGGVAYAGASVGAGRDALAAVFGDGPSLEAADGRYNILLLGGDSGAGRDGVRPDSIQLISVDTSTGRAVTFGFARDTMNIRFRPGSVMAELMPDGWTCGNDCLLNGLHTWASDHADQFPPTVTDPGMTATREAVEALSGLDIQYYALVDLNGFRSLIDSLGGLEITVMRRTPIGGGTSPISGYIEPGTQRLDGYHALWYARSREGSSNYERMARQRCVMSAMVDQVDPRTLALRFGDIAAASTGVLRTDIPTSDLGVFAELAMKTRSQKINGVNFVPPLTLPWDYDAEEIHRIVQETIAASVDIDEESARSTRVQPLPDATATPPTAEPTAHQAHVSDVPASAPPAASDVPAPSVGEPVGPAFDPLERPSEDANAQTDDIASVCSVG